MKAAGKLPGCHAEPANAQIRAKGHKEKPPGLRNPSLARHGDSPGAVAVTPRAAAAPVYPGSGEPAAPR